MIIKETKEKGTIILYCHIKHNKAHATKYDYALLSFNHGSCLHYIQNHYNDFVQKTLTYRKALFIFLFDKWCKSPLLAWGSIFVMLQIHF